MFESLIQFIQNLIPRDIMAQPVSLLLQLLPFLLIPLLISLIDFVTLVRSRFSKDHTLKLDTPEYHNYSLLIPIFGDMKYLKNIAFLQQYRNHVILCTTSKESRKFNDDIERIASQNGFRIFRSNIEIASSKQKPNPWKLFTNTLHNTSVEQEYVNEEARDEIIRDSFSVVETEYCIFIDGDTIAKENLAKLVGIMKQKDFDVASVRVLASKQNTLMEKLQSVEYELAMDARKVYPWLTSGASTIAKTKVIKDIMKHHSLFFSGGDIEIGKLGKMMNYHVGHIPFEFYTDVPATFKAWFKQRMAWFGGGFRHAIINMHQYTWKHPLFYFYTTFLVYLLTPLRWYEVIKAPHVLVLVIFLYWVLIFIFHWRQAKWFYILFPFYALIQIMILVPLGVLTYFKMAYHSNNPGLIKLREKKPRLLYPFPKYSN